MRFWRKRLLARVAQVARETKVEADALRRSIATLAAGSPQADGVERGIVIVHRQAFVIAIRLLRLLGSGPSVEILCARTVPEIDRALNSAVSAGMRAVFVSRSVYHTIRIMGLDSRYGDKLSVRTA